MQLQNCKDALCQHLMSAVAVAKFVSNFCHVSALLPVLIDLSERLAIQYAEGNQRYVCETPRRTGLGPRSEAKPGMSVLYRPCVRSLTVLVLAFRPATNADGGSWWVYYSGLLSARELTSHCSIL